MSDHDQRLPDHVAPRHYELELAPDLGAASFAGSVVIEADVTSGTDEIVCNVADLTIDAVLVEHGTREFEPEVHLDDTTERLHLRLGEQLAPGPIRVRISFRGELNDKLAGFYRSTFTDDAGDERVIATTQFQSTDARRAFPCWDEPAWKATFATTLVVDPDLMAVTNTAPVAESTDADGRRRITFAPTMPMSTYLVAFVVGPLEATEPIDVDGVPVRVVHPPGKGHLTAFALDVAAHGLRWFSDYYGIPYPSDKVDLVAVPDFAFGAMENLGCVTFREVLLLVDPETATQEELENVALVVTHELAHMWFGDLVTMRWWEGIWLNEAFATFMETAATDAFDPDWAIWTSFCRSRAAAFDTDALAATRPVEYPVVSPEEAEGMFDVLTYEKGGSVVRMLERYLGHETFRDGVRRYLAAHAHGNTETSDLWDAIEEASGEPVRRLMDGWILQGGYPLVEVDTADGRTTFAQRHFTLDPGAADDRRWAVPVRYRTHGRDPVEGRVLLDGGSTTIDVGPIVTANVDASGFYRVRLDDAARTRLLADGASTLSPTERHAVVDDSWALTLAGVMTAADFLAVAESLPDEDDLTVWQALGVGLRGLDRIVDDEAAPLLRARVEGLSAAAMDRLGFEPTADEPSRRRELRAALLDLRGSIAHDPETLDAAETLLGHPDATLAAAALAVVARHGDAEVHARITRAWHEADDPQTEQRNLRVLADLPDPTLVLETLAGTLDGSVRSQDGPYLIRRALTNRHAGDATWGFVADNWDAITTTFPSNSIVRMLEGIVLLDDDAAVERVGAFLAAHPVPQGEHQIAQHLEHQRINAVLRRRERERFSDALRR